MPAAARVSNVQLFDALQGLPIFDKEQNLKKERNPIWKEARKLIKNGMSIHNLYQTILNNRGKIQDDLRCAYFGNGEDNESSKK